MSEQRRDVGAVQGTVETSASDAGEAIAALREHEAWAIIPRSTRAGDRDTVGLVGGRRHVVESVLDVPLEDPRAACGGAPPPVPESASELCATEGIRTPNLPTYLSHPTESATVRYRFVPQRIPTTSAP